MCDVSHRVLRTETVRDLMKQLHASNPGAFKDNALKMLIGSIVITRYNNKTYRVDDVAFDKSPKDGFQLTSGSEISYLAYYEKSYQLKILDPNQPLLISMSKVRSTGETKIERTFCLIPELCYLTGLTDAMRSDFRVMREIAQVTRLTPENRHKSLLKFIQSIKSNNEAKEVLAGTVVYFVVLLAHF